MRKRSKYKPKGVRPDANNWVLAGMIPFNNVAVGVDIRIKNHLAMEQLRLGQATKDDIDLIIGTFNMMEGFVRLGIGTDWSEEIRVGQDALLSVARRGVERGMRFVCTATELVALNLAMQIHDAQLDNCTVRQLEKALDIVKEDIIHKKARAIHENSNSRQVAVVHKSPAEVAS
jgi:hypothetical protein